MKVEIAELKEELEKQKASALVSSNLLKHQETSAMELSQRLSERQAESDQLQAEKRNLGVMLVRAQDLLVASKQVCRKQHAETLDLRKILTQANSKLSTHHHQQQQQQHGQASIPAKLIMAMVGSVAIAGSTDTAHVGRADTYLTKQARAPQYSPPCSPPIKVASVPITGHMDPAPVGRIDADITEHARLLQRSPRRKVGSVPITGHMDPAPLGRIDTDIIEQARLPQHSPPCSPPRKVASVPITGHMDPAPSGRIDADITEHARLLQRSPPRKVASVAIVGHMDSAPVGRKDADITEHARPPQLSPQRTRPPSVNLPMDCPPSASSTPFQVSHEDHLQHSGPPSATRSSLSYKDPLQQSRPPSATWSPLSYKEPLQQSRTPTATASPISYKEPLQQTRPPSSSSREEKYLPEKYQHETNHTAGHIKHQSAPSRSLGTSDPALKGIAFCESLGTADASTASEDREPLVQLHQNQGSDKNIAGKYVQNTAGKCIQNTVGRSQMPVNVYAKELNTSAGTIDDINSLEVDGHVTNSARFPVPPAVVRLQQPDCVVAGGVNNAEARVLPCTRAQQPGTGTPEEAREKQPDLEVYRGVNRAEVQGPPSEAKAKQPDLDADGGVNSVEASGLPNTRAQQPVTDPSSEARAEQPDLEVDRGVNSAEVPRPPSEARVKQHDLEVAGGVNSVEASGLPNAGAQQPDPGPSDEPSVKQPNPKPIQHQHGEITRLTHTRGTSRAPTEVVNQAPVPAPVPAPSRPPHQSPVPAPVPRPLQDTHQAPVSALVPSPLRAPHQAPVPAHDPGPVRAFHQSPVPAPVPAPLLPPQHLAPQLAPDPKPAVVQQLVLTPLPAPELAPHPKPAVVQQLVHIPLPAPELAPDPKPAVVQQLVHTPLPAPDLAPELAPDPNPAVVEDFKPRLRPGEVNRVDGAWHTLPFPGASNSSRQVLRASQKSGASKKGGIDQGPPQKRSSENVEEPSQRCLSEDDDMPLNKRQKLADDGPTRFLPADEEDVKPVILEGKRVRVTTSALGGLFACFDESSSSQGDE